MPPIHASVELYCAGFGFILYSPPSVSHIKPGSNYFEAHFADEAGVQPHIQAGTLIGVNTGSVSCEYRFNVRLGRATEDELDQFRFTYFVPVDVREPLICFGDLFELISWEPGCPPEQCVSVECGYYGVTFCTDGRTSELEPEIQDIEVFMEPTTELPRTCPRGIPWLFEYVPDQEPSSPD